MLISSLTIENFRGVKSLNWTLPAEQKLITLVGAGDSGKSTILEAVHYLLGDRWNITFTDADFYGVDPANSISITAVLLDVPSSLLKDSTFGLWQSGLDADGQLHQDPEDEYAPCLIVSLRVDEALEPRWSVERVYGQSQMLTSTQRRAFSTFKVDDRTDSQLRWSRTSALGRMSVQDGGERSALAAASRAARDALADHENSSLADLALKVQERANAIGGGRFAAIKPGLDTSRSGMGAALALYEDLVPLTSFGLGSRRLASLAVQQLGAGPRAIAVVDEIEEGLEPHRAVRLLDYLSSDDDYSQVLVTTHSPVIVEQARIESLAVVNNHDGDLTVTSLGESGDEVQRVRRSRPSSLLARKIIVAEGKTEHGLLLACVEKWDAERVSAGLSTSAGEGLAIQDGQGGSEVAPRTSALAGLGYDVIALLDNDDRSVDAKVTAAEASGAQIVRWELGNCTEQQVVAKLGTPGLTALLALGVEVRNDEATVLADINSVDVEHPVETLDVADWLEQGIDENDARKRIAEASIKRKWFKDVDDGRALGVWLTKYEQQAALSEVFERLNLIKEFIYQGAA